MKINIRNELIPLNLLVIILIIAIIAFPSSGLRIVLGLPFLLFFPGYTLMAALFTRREGMGASERIALSFGISIAIVPLIGLILNYTPWGIRLETVLYSVASFVFITSIVAWLRRKRLPEQEGFSIRFQLRLPGWSGSAWDKACSVVLAISILAVLGTLSYVIATPKVGERFTEFYILGQEGEAAAYPQELKIGETGKVVVGIINQENETVNYHLDVMIEGMMNNRVESLSLEIGDKWEEVVNFTPDRAGDNQKVEILLYRNGQSEPYLEPLHFWINVKE